MPPAQDEDRLYVISHGHFRTTKLDIIASNSETDGFACAAFANSHFFAAR